MMKDPDINKTSQTKRERLTLKQDKFCKEYVKAKGNGTRAALKSYETTQENTAGMIASRLIRQDRIKERIEELLEGTEESVRGVIREGLRAKTVTSQGRETLAPDYKERRKMAELIVDMRGLRRPRQTENTSIQITAQLETLTEPQLKQLLERELDKLKDDA